MEPADLAAATRLYEAKIKIRAAEDGFVAVSPTEPWIGCTFCQHWSGSCGGRFLKQMSSQDVFFKLYHLTQNWPMSLPPPISAFKTDKHANWYFKNDYKNDEKRQLYYLIYPLQIIFYVIRQETIHTEYKSDTFTNWLWKHISYKDTIFISSLLISLLFFHCFN